MGVFIFLSKIEAVLKQAVYNYIRMAKTFPSGIAEKEAPMRILLLTGGEATAADTNLLESALASPDRDCIRRNSADFFTCRLPYLLARRLRWLEKHPRTCQSRRGFPHRFFSGAARELRLYLEQEQFDMIVCRQVFPALLLTEALRQHPVTAKTCLVTTGDTCPPGTELCAMDYYVLPREELRPLFLDRGIPEEKLIFLCQSPKGA